MGWQGSRRDKLTAAHLLKESRCFWQWLYAELFSQDTPANLVLGQSCRTLAVVSQEQHLLSVGLFAPGLQNQQPLGGCQSGLIRAFGDAVIRQPAQPTQNHPVEMFPLRKQPILENRCVAYGKAFQQPASVESGCLLPALQLFAVQGESKVVRTISTSSQ